MIQRIAILLVTLFAILASPAAAQTTEAGFRTFLEQQIWPQARAKGVSRGTFDAALRGVAPTAIAATSMRPPRGVYFAAFVSRLPITRVDRMLGYCIHASAYAAIRRNPMRIE